MDIKNIDPYTIYFRYLSIFINLLVFYFWLKSKLVQSIFLSGRWEGTLLCTRSDDSNIDVKLDCILIINRHSKNDNTAILYYKQTSIGENRKYIQGVDLLHNFNPSSFFFWHKKWEPTFIRELHIDKSTITSTENTDLKKVYNWNCNITSYWLKEKMALIVQSQSQDVAFKGNLQKI